MILIKVLVLGMAWALLGFATFWIGCVLLAEPVQRASDQRFADAVGEEFERRVLLTTFGRWWNSVETRFGAPVAWSLFLIWLFWPWFLILFFAALQTVHEQDFP